MNRAPTMVRPAANEDSTWCCPYLLLRSSSPCQQIPAASGRSDFKIRTGFRERQLGDREAGERFVETL